jgi:hypothetical protein
MKHLKNFKQFEDVASATTAGMGTVVSSQPSSLPGTLNGTSFSSGGGTSGSGDIGFPLISSQQKKRVKRKIGKKSTKNAGDLRYLGKENILGKFPIKR